MTRATHIVALSGSLRGLSVNAELLRKIAALAPAGVTVEIVPLGDLPLFNPDLEPDLPHPVAAFRNRIAAADALIIASPEYAHGISGVIKNALDWLVASEDFAGMPVAVLNAAPRAHHADTALREILSTMAARIVHDASITVSNATQSTATPSQPPVSEMLAGGLAALVAVSRQARANDINDEPHDDSNEHDSDLHAPGNKGPGQ